ncbi:MAG TPA: alkaline phosphatase [Terrimicrobiaceae bacterium]|nr:alkaline phosphatase [Terrimicrobiaceae bacterium]
MLRFFPLLLVFLALPACSPPAGKVRGVVLLVADGTSLELLAAARFFQGGARGQLALDGMPHSAIVRTASASHLVTDSSAAATALARGIKADNRMVGIAGRGSGTVSPSILDLAKKAGWTTAVVTDDSVTGGTPSPFLIEHDNRNEHDRIAVKIGSQLGSRVDFLVGGGAKWFSDRSGDPGVVYQPGQRENARMAQEALTAADAAVFTSWEAFQSGTRDGSPRPALAVFAPEEFSYFADGLRTLRLLDLVQETLRLLQSRGKPYFLVVEASLPDKAAHGNHARRAMAEVLEFDAVVQWLRGHVGPDVLILATTDHNTGGIVVNGYPPAQYQGERLLGKDPVSGAGILTFASGPGADPAAANVRKRIVHEAGQPSREVAEAKDPLDPDFAQPALIPSRSALHTGGDVWAFAQGPGAGKVRGSMENTEIFRVMAEAVAGKP